LTPRRTIAVAVLTFVAVVASPNAAAAITGLLVGNSKFAHPLDHLLWGLFTLAIALGMCRLRRAWPAPAPDLLLPARAFGKKQYQLLALAQWLALAVAAGQFLSSAGAADFNEKDLYFAIVHTTGLMVVIGSFGALLLVCLHMLGVGVRGVLRPAAHAS
jgi:hypothetical protein